jgi:predicted RNA-binding protein
MCEASAYEIVDGKEVLFMESVDLLEPVSEHRYRLTSIFGEQKIINGKIVFMNLVNHKMVFQPGP